VTAEPGFLWQTCVYNRSLQFSGGSEKLQVGFIYSKKKGDKKKRVIKKKAAALVIWLVSFALHVIVWISG